MNPNDRPPKHRFPHLLLAALLIFGAFGLRIDGLAEDPRGLYSDEAASALQALRIAQTGGFPLYLPTPAPEDLHAVLAAPFVGLIGPSLFSIRLFSAFLGILGVAAAYRAARHLAPVSGLATPSRRGLAPVPGLGRWMGLLAAGLLAAMPGHLTLSRAVFRGLMLAPALLLFFDAFVSAWRWGRRRDFAAAGAWLAVSVMSYTSGLAALPVAAAGWGYVGISHFWLNCRRQDTHPAFWNRALAFGLSLLIAASPHIALMIIRPGFYARAAALQTGEAAPLTERLAGYAGGLLATGQSFIVSGDPNPRYNAAQQPLINDPLLAALFALGVVTCLFRLRRLGHFMALTMLVVMALPVALSNEIPHGLRISGEFAAIPLVTAAAIEPLVWAVRWLSSRAAARLAQPLAALGGAGLLIVLAAANLHTRQVYDAYFAPRPGQELPADVPDFATIFETRRLTIAQMMARHDAVYYLPLSETVWSPMRYFTAQGYPRVETYATYFKGQNPIELPAGRFVFTSGARRAQTFVPNQGDSTRVIAPPPPAREATTFAAYMPDGTLVLLPRFDEPTLARLREALSQEQTSSHQTLTEPYGETAATVIDFPPEGEPLTIKAEPGHVTDLDFSSQLRMVGWDGPDRLEPGGGTLEATLYLARGAAFDRDLRVFAQVWDSGSTLAGSSEEPSGLYSLVYPTGEWALEDVAPYVVRINLSGPLAPGAYSLMIGAYDWRGELVPVLLPPAPWEDFAKPADIGAAARLKVPLDEPVSTDGMVAVASNIEFGDQIELLGYRIDGEDGQPVKRLKAGRAGTITLFWRAIRRPDADYTFFLHVEDGAQAMAAQFDAQPMGGQYPTGIWDAGEIITSTHPINLPADAKGPFTVYVGAYSFPSLERLAAMQGGQPAPDNRVTLIEQR